MARARETFLAQVRTPDLDANVFELRSSLTNLKREALDQVAAMEDQRARLVMPQLYEQNLSFEERERRVGEWVAGSFNAIPVPWIDPEDVADAIAFLTSDRARYVTGEVLDLAAGANARNSA